VDVIVSKASFKNTSLNNRFRIKVCRHHKLGYHLTARECVMLYVAFFPCKPVTLLVHSQHVYFKKMPHSPLYVLIKVARRVIILYRN
jgi:hypothetical protein